MEKKSSGQPTRFKTGRSITAYLAKLKLLPQDDWTVDKNMRICGGLIWKQDAAIHMTCTVKAQGGGKSMLKQSLILGKKMGFAKFEDVTFVKVADAADADEGVEVVHEQAESDPMVAKYLKLHQQVVKASSRFFFY